MQSWNKHNFTFVIFVSFFLIGIHSMQGWKARHGGLAWQEKKYKKIKFGLSAFFLLTSIIKSFNFFSQLQRWAIPVYYNLVVVFSLFFVLFAFSIATENNGKINTLCTYNSFSKIHFFSDQFFKVTLPMSWSYANIWTCSTNTFFQIFCFEHEVTRNV